MKKFAAYTVAIMMLPVAIIIYSLKRAWEWWHFGPSNSILRFLRWLDYKAFKRIIEWCKMQMTCVNK